MTALTESVAPAVAIGRGHAAQSANLTATAVAAGTERERGHQKTKVGLCYLEITPLSSWRFLTRRHSYCYHHLLSVIYFGRPQGDRGEEQL